MDEETRRRDEAVAIHALRADLAQHVMIPCRPSALAGINLEATHLAGTGHSRHQRMEGSVFCLPFPDSQDFRAEAAVIGVDRMRVILAEPDPVGRVLALFTGQRGVVPGASGRRGGDVRCDADIDRAGTTLVCSGCWLPAMGMRAAMAGLLRQQFLGGPVEIIPHG
ncbi:hypothetical protein AE922_03450 [Xanthomonas arboricola]|uniref:hypothetical protein n=1 Tax=Xanthomonas arboricola TaxID=56448 RepID=UPI00069CFBBE|nr:hypothetical protein [Xanthomonas arboricola]KOB10690.1 hypothetical protein AE922_03450 [Xanthomonas arboricola]